MGTHWRCRYCYSCIGRRLWGFCCTSVIRPRQTILCCHASDGRSQNSG